jgi:hypothetical protein
MADRDRSRTTTADTGSRSRMAEERRNTEIKRETDIHNSMGPSGGDQDEMMREERAPQRDRTRGRSDEQEF